MKSLNLLIGVFVLMGFLSFGQVDKPYVPSAVGTSSFKEAHPTIDIYAASTLKCGSWGAGFGFFSKPILLAEINKSHPVNMCIGGDFYFLQMQHKNLGYVPYSASENGEAELSLSQSNYGVNAVARFILEASPKIKPYADVFIGARGFSSDANFSNVITGNGKSSDNSQNLSAEWHWNYGGSIGVLYAFNSRVSLNTALMLTSSQTYGSIDNVKTASYENGSLVTSKMDTPKNTAIVKLGVNIALGSRAKKTRCACVDEESSSEHDDAYVREETKTKEQEKDDYYVPGTDYVDHSKDIKNQEESRRIERNRIIWNAVFEIAIQSLFTIGTGGIGGG